MNIRIYLEMVLSYILFPSKRKLIRLSRTFAGKTGLEIGGPSRIFGNRGYFPIYVFSKTVDGVNFSNETIWEGKLKEGKNYEYFPGHEGFQFISEASNLSPIQDQSYDFLVSSHCLEHVANPIQTLKEWRRVLKPGGQLILILPDKEFIFDRNRPDTTMNHLIDDYINQTGEDDTTHFEEVVELSDLTLDPFVESRESLKIRTASNYTNRCIHHHIFNLPVVREMLEYAGYQVSHQQKGAPHHLITVAQSTLAT